MDCAYLKKQVKPPLPLLLLKPVLNPSEKSGISLVNMEKNLLLALAFPALPPSILLKLIAEVSMDYGAASKTGFPTTNKNLLLTLKGEHLKNLREHLKNKLKIRY